MEPRPGTAGLQAWPGQVLSEATEVGKGPRCGSQEAASCKQHETTRTGVCPLPMGPLSEAMFWGHCQLCGVALSLQKVRSPAV